MNRYRQNIQRQNSKCNRNNVLEEYGMTSRELKTDLKEPRSKSKSKKKIMIAKNKKLPQSFTLSRKIKQENKSSKHRQSESNKKSDRLLENVYKKPTYVREKQDEFDVMKKPNFGLNQKNDKENIRLKTSTQILIKPQTYFSDRVQAFELRERLKKSTSMKNLIEQRFVQSSEKEKNYWVQIEHKQTKEPTKQYDSTKYNWRLSKSKEKLLKQKSLSALSSKTKFMCDLQKKQINRNKLTLDNSLEPKQNRLKLKNQQILSFQYNPQNLKKDTNLTQAKRNHLQQNLSYTFGSDLMKSLHFG